MDKEDINTKLPEAIINSTETLTVENKEVIDQEKATIDKAELSKNEFITEDQNDASNKNDKHTEREIIADVDNHINNQNKDTETEKEKAEETKTNVVNQVIEEEKDKIKEGTEIEEVKKESSVYSSDEDQSTLKASKAIDDFCVHESSDEFHSKTTELYAIKEYSRIYFDEELSSLQSSEFSFKGEEDKKEYTTNIESSDLKNDDFDEYNIENVTGNDNNSDTNETNLDDDSLSSEANEQSIKECVPVDVSSDDAVYSESDHCSVGEEIENVDKSNNKHAIKDFETVGNGSNDNPDITLEKEENLKDPTIKENLTNNIEQNAIDEVNINLDVTNIDECKQNSNENPIELIKAEDSTNLVSKGNNEIQTIDSENAKENNDTPNMLSAIETNDIDSLLIKKESENIEKISIDVVNEVTDKQTHEKDINAQFYNSSIEEETGDYETAKSIEEKHNIAPLKQSLESEDLVYQTAQETTETYSNEKEEVIEDQDEDLQNNFNDTVTGTWFYYVYIL